MPLTKTKQSTDRVTDFFRQTYKRAGDRRFRELAVLELVRQHTISAAKGAELLDLYVGDFIDLMARHRIPLFELLPGETLKKHLAKGEVTLRKIRGERS